MVLWTISVKKKALINSWLFSIFSAKCLNVAKFKCIFWITKKVLALIWVFWAELKQNILVVWITASSKLNYVQASSRTRLWTWIGLVLFKWKSLRKKAHKHALIILVSTAQSRQCPQQNVVRLLQIHRVKVKKDRKYSESNEKCNELNFISLGLFWWKQTRNWA